MDDVIERIRECLRLYEPRQQDGTGRPRAAVLVPLYAANGDLHVVLTKRSQRVVNHRGEIAFPGGGVEPGDADLLATALREAEEEVGLRAVDVRILGRLDDVITTSTFHVAVYVGEINPAAAPYAWCCQEDEVDCLLEVPLSHLKDGTNLVSFERERNGEIVTRQGYRFGEEIIWGATGQMVRNLLEVIAEPATPTGIEKLEAV
jgi:8-oxo-dGTP pyrophosphatase MutT (NUDIX family)